MSLIKITHFTNPHEFVYRIADNTDRFDNALADLEKKIASIVVQLPSDDRKLERTFQTISTGANVVFFWSDCNKWIRAVVNMKDVQNNLLHIWANDYGFPFIANHRNVRVFMEDGHRSLLERNLSKQRIKIGALSNASPTQLHYNISSRDREVKPSQTWSPFAIATLQEMIGNAVKLNFERVHEFEIKGTKRTFGRLMLQNVNGEWVDALEGLLSLELAQRSNMIFDRNLKTVSVVGIGSQSSLHTRVTPVLTDIMAGSFATIKRPSTDLESFKRLQINENGNTDNNSKSAIKANGKHQIFQSEKSPAPNLMPQKAENESDLKVVSMKSPAINKTNDVSKLIKQRTGLLFAKNDCTVPPSEKSSPNKVAKSDLSSAPAAVLPDNESSTSKVKSDSPSVPAAVLPDNESSASKVKSDLSSVPAAALPCNESSTSKSKSDSPSVPAAVFPCNELLSTSKGKSNSPSASTNKRDSQRNKDHEKRQQLSTNNNKHQ